MKHPNENSFEFQYSLNGCPFLDGGHDILEMVTTIYDVFLKIQKMPGAEFS